MKTPADQFLDENVEMALQQVGRNLRLARVRRMLTQEEIAQRLGVDRRSIAKAEKGNPSTPLKLVLALLDLYGLLPQADQLANPDQDKVGKALELKRLPQRIHRTTIELDNDF